MNALAALQLATADSSGLTRRHKPTHFWYGTVSLLSTEKQCGDGVCSKHGRLGGREGRRKQGRMEGEKKRVAWKEDRRRCSCC